MQVYDGETNEKVLQYQTGSSWQYTIFTGDYFDGSNKQLWSFEATDMYPGYFSIVNHQLGDEYHLMSYNWLAYFTSASNRDPDSDKEMQYKFVDMGNGYYKLETIEKPTDGSLYGIYYTSGADALNVDESGQADFGDVKSADITTDNMVNMVFKLVEFDPVTLFDESIVRGDELYNNNSDAPEQALYDLFYVLEKAREIRVFGTEADMLAYQATIDEAFVNFDQVLSILSIISDARTFIDASSADDETKNAFNAMVDDAEATLYEGTIDYDDIEELESKIENAESLVVAIIAAQAYNETLAGMDARLSAGMVAAIDDAKAVLADLTFDGDDYASSISYLAKLQELIENIVIANELIASTDEFEDAKATLNAVLEEAITVISNSGTVDDLDVSLVAVQDAIAAFQKALEAGDTIVELRNANFDEGKTDWITDSPTPGSAYPSTKGVDGSSSITCWSGSAYQMKFYQSLSGLPDGTYILSAYISTNVDGGFELFAESGTTVSELSISLESGLVKRELQVEVVGGILEFGVRGAGENNGLSGGNWVVLDDFELKWSSSMSVVNPEFDDGTDGYTNNGTSGVPYASNKGVDGSKSLTFWSGSEYTASFSQELEDIPNGTYTVSVSVMTQAFDSLFIFYGTDGIDTTKHVILQSTSHSKIKITVPVKSNSLTFGFLGAGENNTVPGGRWLVIDQVELTRIPDVPIVNAEFNDGKTGWTTDSPTPGSAYPSAKGVDGSKSITSWSGSAYQMKFYQTLSGLVNGTYSVSAFLSTNRDGAFNFFAEGGADESILSVSTEGGLAERQLECVVADGHIDFGVKGAGENNGLEAGSWVILDNFQLLLKSITPVYEVVEPTPAQMLVTDIETQKLDNKVTYWQANQRLNIQSANAIVKYSVYSITGAMVEQKETRNNNLSIPMKRGIYVIRVFTENGFMDTEKVIIR
jgi:hypothetical protein